MLLIYLYLHITLQKSAHLETQEDHFQIAHYEIVFNMKISYKVPEKICVFLYLVFTH